MLHLKAGNQAFHLLRQWPATDHVVTRRIFFKNILLGPCPLSLILPSQMVWPAAACYCFSLDYRQMVVDTANESQVAGLSFAVSTTIWEHPGQHISHLVTLCYTFGNVLMKSEKISQNPSFDNFLKNKKWKVIDTANERSVAGLSYAVSTNFPRHVGQKLCPSFKACPAIVRVQT